MPLRELLNLGIIFKLVGINLLLISITLLSCIPVALIYHESALPFLVSSAITIIPGTLCYYNQRSISNTELYRRDGYVIVSLNWIVLGLSGSLPYLISGSIPSAVDAIFESISGYSTTGASILTDIEALPYSILYWRSLTHWIGGIGIIVLVIVIMPSLKVSGYTLFSMESSLQEKIKPRTVTIGYILVLIYIALTVLEVIFLLCGGMSLFESVCHAYGTVATGGFSPKNTSIAGYSPYIQYVITFFMLAAGINFSLYYFVIKKEFKKIWINSEFWFYLVVVLIIGMILTVSLVITRGKEFEPMGLTVVEGIVLDIMKDDDVSAQNISVTGCKVYPNPSSIKTYFTFENPAHASYMLTIFNSKGQLVKSLTGITGAKAMVDNSRLGDGLYFYRITDGTRLVAKGKYIVCW